jgi:hypothetical protein
MIDLPVSFGEALDKLTILEIKLDKIKDARRNDVKVEYDLLLSKLDPYFTEDSKYHYSILKDVNLKIWEMQDSFRDSQDDSQKSALCMKIIEDNDRRFRIKSKLNELFNSHLKEQKGYKKKKAFILSHLGLGDCLTISGAVRYLSTCYDEVKVVCKKKYYENLKLFYQDDSTITFHIVEDDSKISPNFGYPFEDFLRVTEGYDRFLCGQHSINGTMHSFAELPFCFYKDIGVDPTTFWTYFHIPSTEESKRLRALLENPYILLHTSCSTGEIATIEAIETKLGLSRETMLFLDINKNIYPEGHPYHEISNEFVNKPLAHYKDTLLNADAVILTDSALFCMAVNLPLRTRYCFYISRSNNYDYFYGSEYGYSKESGKKVFHALTL